MGDLKKLIENNRNWAKAVKKADPNFFKRSANVQKPRHLWIGCADSRIPANEVIGLHAGELFVHRNVGNMVYMTDMNCLTVLQYAVFELKVKHIILCGHYGCGGVKTAIKKSDHGLAYNWIFGIREVYQENKVELDAIEDDEKRENRLSELNVNRQVRNLCQTTIVNAAWENGMKLTIYGVVYDITNGKLHDLGMSISSEQQAEKLL